MWVRGKQEYAQKKISEQTVSAYERALDTNSWMDNEDALGNHRHIIPHGSMIVSRGQLYGCGIVYRGKLPNGASEVFLDGNNTPTGEGDRVERYVINAMKMAPHVRKSITDTNHVERLHYFLKGHVVETRDGGFFLTGEDVFGGNEGRGPLGSLVFGRSLLESVPARLKVDLFSCNLLGGIAFTVEQKTLSNGTRTLWSNCLHPLLVRPIALPQDLSPSGIISHFDFKFGPDAPKLLSLGIDSVLLSDGENRLIAAGRTMYIREKDLRKMVDDDEEYQSRIEKKRVLAGKKPRTTDSYTNNVGWYDVDISHITAGIRTLISGSTAVWILDNDGEIWCCGKIPANQSNISLGISQQRFAKLLPDDHSLREVSNKTLGFEQIYEFFGNCLGRHQGQWYQWGIPMELIMRVDFEYRRPQQYSDNIIFTMPLRLPKLKDHKLIGHFGSHAWFAKPVMRKRIPIGPEFTGEETATNTSEEEEEEVGEVDDGGNPDDMVIDDTRKGQKDQDEGDPKDVVTKISNKPKRSGIKPNAPKRTKKVPKTLQSSMKTKQSPTTENVVAIGGNGVFGLGVSRIAGGFPKRPERYTETLGIILGSYRDKFTDSELDLLDFATGDPEDFKTSAYASDIYLAKLYHQTPLKVKGLHYDPIRRVKLDSDQPSEYSYSRIYHPSEPEEFGDKYLDEVSEGDLTKLQKKVLLKSKRTSEEDDAGVLGKRRGAFGESDTKRSKIGCAICPEKIALYQCGKCRKVKYCSEWCLRHHWNSGEHHKNCSRC